MPSISEVGEVCDTLGQIAETYPAKSRQARALQIAAEVVLFMSGRQVWLDYLRFMRQRKRPLRKWQERLIAQYGLPAKTGARRTIRRK